MREHVVGDIGARDQSAARQVLVHSHVIPSSSRPIGQPRRANDRPFEVAALHLIFHEHEVGVPIFKEPPEDRLGQPALEQRAGIEASRGDTQQAAHVGGLHRAHDIVDALGVDRGGRACANTERRDHRILACHRLVKRTWLKHIALDNREPFVLDGNCGGVAGDRSDVVTGGERLRNHLATDAAGRSEYYQFHSFFSSAACNTLLNDCSLSGLPVTQIACTWPASMPSDRTTSALPPACTMSAGAPFTSTTADCTPAVRKRVEASRKRDTASRPRSGRVIAPRALPPPSVHSSTSSASSSSNPAIAPLPIACMNWLSIWRCASGVGLKRGRCL